MTLVSIPRQFRRLSHGEHYHVTNTFVIEAQTLLAALHGPNTLNSTFRSCALWCPGWRHPDSLTSLNIWYRLRGSASLIIGRTRLAMPSVIGPSFLLLLTWSRLVLCCHHAVMSLSRSFYSAALTHWHFSCYYLYHFCTAQLKGKASIMFIRKPYIRLYSSCLL